MSQQALNNNDLGFQSSASGVEQDRLSNCSMRWQSYMLPPNTRMSKTRGWSTTDHSLGQNRANNSGMTFTPTNANDMSKPTEIGSMSNVM